MLRSLLKPLYYSTARTLQGFCPQPPVVADLRDEHVAHAVLLANRQALLDWMPKGGKVVECGVDEGGFSAKILSHCQPDELTLIDLWGSARYSEKKMNDVKARFAKEIEENRVKILRELSVDGLSKLPDGETSWFYIDTSHNYKTTAAELLLCAKKVKPGGIIAGHDYSVGNWNSYYRYGVVEAVNEFCVNEGWGFAAVTHETDRMLSFALRRLEDF